MKRITAFIIFSLSLLNFCNANENLRSDTIDVLQYRMELDITDFANETLKANCVVNFASKMNNVNTISLDLLGFQVDSVKRGPALLNYDYNDTLLVVDLATTLNTGDTDSVKVFYQGTPPQDPSGFGGFYFQGDYAYNLGVGFEADPHNYGRVWHPCFDNFVERAAYDITISTPSDKFAYSNGYIASENNSATGNTRRWILNEHIPTYLACVGVAPYTHVEEEYTSTITSDQIPVMLIAEPQDTTAFKNAFVNLNGAMTAFESQFGPYEWNKVAFALVPFSGGAMEHATCIMYPRITANGTTQYETLMAHELSHHWWGNLVTCQTAEDMWINEGLATYCESIFLEEVYDYETYLDEITAVHSDVLQTAHYDDEAFLPLSGVPHNATYGTHTYSKGATMMHNLRTYLGDEDFFAGLQYIQQNFAMTHIDAAGFQNALESATGADLEDFFNNYVHNPGFNGIEVDSFTVANNNVDFDVNVFLQQKLFEAPDLFSDVPVTVTFAGTGGQRTTRQMTVSGASSQQSFNVPFRPEMVILNEGSELLNAVTGENRMITEPGQHQMDEAKFFLRVNSASDSSFVRIEHYRVSPDPIVSPYIGHQFVISPDRYWKVDGMWSNTFEAEGRITYNAKDVAAGNLDNGLMTDHSGVDFEEDSLVMLWRPHQGTRWEEYPFYEQSTLGSTTDGYGRFELPQLLKGEYAFGFRKNVAGTSHESKQDNVRLFPNPSKDEVEVNVDQSAEDGQIFVYAQNGAQVYSGPMTQPSTRIDVSDWKKGSYHVIVYQNNDVFGVQQFIKQ